MSKDMTVKLVLDIIKKAMKKENVTAELQLHSDQGSQYVSHDYFVTTQYIKFYNNYRIQTKTKLTPLEKRNQFVA